MKISRNLIKSSSSPAGSGRASPRIFAIIYIFTVLSLSGLYLRFAWIRYNDIVSSEATMLARSLVSLLHPEHILELSGTAADLEKPEYNMTKLSLMRLVKEINPIHFAYLMAERDASIIFLLDSEMPEDPDYAPPGLVYSEVGDAYRGAFLSGKTVLTKPVTDRWGTWISVLVPIQDPAIEKVIAVFGIDYSAADWNLGLWKRMIPDVIIALSFLFLFVALLNTWIQHSVLKELSRKLTLDEALYRSMFEQAPIGIALVNDKSFISQTEFGHMNINPMFERILGRTSRDLDNLNWADITHPDDLHADLEKFMQFKRGEINDYTLEKRFLRPDGSSVWTNMKISPLLDIPHKHSLHLCLLEDISARKEINETLKESERSKAVLLANLPGMAYRCKYDRKWTMQYVSAGCYKLTGYTAESLINNRDISFNDIITPEYRDAIWEKWKEVLAQKKTFRYEYEIVTSEGKHKWILELAQGICDNQGNVEGIEGVIFDISDRKKMEDQLKYNSEHDAWTGLYNRKHLCDTFENDQKSKTLGKTALVGINLNSINFLSLRYGFQYSQELIKKAADALKAHCSLTHLLFYTYENRFVFYVKAYKDKEELQAFCEAIAKSLDSILAVDRIGGGIGVLEIEESNSLDIGQLLKNLLVASEKEVNNAKMDIGISFFNEGIHGQILREEDINRELTQIAAGKNVERLFLEYQPIFDLKLKRICAFEALARLNSNSYGRVPPIEFIPIAEKTKLIIPLGNEVLLQAFNFLNRLKENGYTSIAISVNISIIQLLRDGFVKNFFRMINGMHINPDNITLEITESVFASNYREVNSILGELKKLGISIAVDDFGTEYSSLARVLELNVNCIKIDKYFIDQLSEINSGNAITGDIISMGHRLGHCVIAEGVENEAQLQYLKDKGCDKIQGYLIGKPLGKEAAMELIAKQPKEY